MDRFEQFMRKWEPELESMKDMITELHEAKFPDDNVGLKEQRMYQLKA
jgi:hypothetical protein